MHTIFYHILVIVNILYLTFSGMSHHSRLEEPLPYEGMQIEFARRIDTAVLVRNLTYDKHTLEDVYPYKDTIRRFQWDKIRDTLTMVDSVQKDPVHWVTLQNYKNKNGVAPLVNSPIKNEYNVHTDRFGVDRYQSIPLYSPDNLETPVRYARDGALVRYLADSADYVKICSPRYDGQWVVPGEYVLKLDTIKFRNTIFVDRTNQNIAVLEKTDTAWLIRSMNPATTGLRRPPYQYETPLGVYVIQEKKAKMFYTHDGSSKIAGFAPYASRFTRGGYIHGVPLTNPEATPRNYIEISRTLGTTPRSHMCVRSATSHAKYIYDSLPTLQTLVFVID